MKKLKLDNRYTTSDNSIVCNQYCILMYHQLIYIGISPDLKFPAVCDVNEENKEIYIIFRQNEYDAVRISYIAHEVSHAVEFVGDFIGEQLKGEARAYLTAYMTDQCIHYLKHKNMKLDIACTVETSHSSYHVC